MKGETPTRAIALLALASFASQTMVRVSDPLLPQIAADVGTTIGAASVITSAYAVSHGASLLIAGPFGDRFPKFAIVTLVTLLCAVTVAACGASRTLTELGIARLLSGLTAGPIITFGIAFIGDTVPYEKRQPVIGRFLAGQILGLAAGQIVGGVIGDHLGWRSVFYVIAGIFLVVGLGLLVELLRNPLTRQTPPRQESPVSFIGGYASVLEKSWARIILFAVFAESALFFAPFAFIGADLHARQDLSFTAVGIVLSMFGIGGLIYVVSVEKLVGRLGQQGLVFWGGVLMALAFLALALIPLWWVSAAAIGATGLGLYMLHNTLQVNATQMAPDNRATAMSLFTVHLYIGQSAGVAAVAPLVDRYGAPPIYIAAAILWPLLCFWFLGKLRRRTANTT
jgi:predicted MFS family arabinose efflux permease